MDASDDSGAQPWLADSRSWSGVRQTRPCASVAHAKGFFDVFEDIGEKEIAPLAVPNTAAHFDIATDDEPTSTLHDPDDEPPVLNHKKEQDDHGALLPPPQTWHDTSLERTHWADVALDDTDFAFHDAIAELANLNGQEFCDSQELRTRSGPSATSSQHHAQCGPFEFGSDELCALGNSDTLGYDYSLGPQSDIHAGLHIPQTSRAQCGPLPSDGFEATVDPGRGRSEPAVAAAAVAAAAAKSLKGEAATNVAASDPDSPGSVASVSHAAGHVDFQDFARAVLPDVFPSTGSSVQGSRSDIDSVTSAEDQSPDGELAPLPLRGTGSPGTSPGGGQGQGTQCGPLPRDHTTRTSPQQSPLTLVVQATGVDADVDLGFPDFDGYTIFDLDGDGRPVTQDQGSGTQCGPLPQHMLGKDFISLTSQTQYPIGGTQFGPLPHGLDSSHAFAVEASPSQDAGKRDSPCPQTSRTQCGHLPRVDDNPLEGLQTSLAHLLNVSLEQPAPLDQRAAALEAYAAATRQFALALGLDDSPAAVDTSSLHFDGTQCGPLPQQLQPQQAQYAPPAMTSEPLPSQSSSHSTSSRTQCGPLPQAATSRLKDSSSMTLPTPRAQCGPLPQPSTQSGPPQQDSSLRKGKGKGKRKRNTKPLTLAQSLTA